MVEAFALQKPLAFFNKNFWHYSDISVWNVNEMLTNDVVSFEQQGPGLQILIKMFIKILRA